MPKKNIMLAKMLFISIFLVIIVAIILLVVVWSNFANNISGQDAIQEYENMKSGTFIYEIYDNNYALQKYLEKINTYLLNSDIENLYNLLSEDYKEYYGSTRESIYSNLKGKNAFGKQFLAADYIVTNIENKNVYKVKLNSNDNTTSLDINIIEESPNKFKIALDEFIMRVNRNTEQTINGLTLKIKDVIYFNNRIVTNTTLANFNNYYVTINYQALNENVFYRVGNGNNSIDYITEASVFNGEVKTMSSNSDIELKFDLHTDSNIFNSISSLVIKDVKLTENSSSMELVYDF